MRAIEHILDFLRSARTDGRIRPLHISLYLALYQYWVLSDCINPVLISRRKIMEIAKVKSIVSYHKGMQELCAFGYISYTPSFDPRIRTTVYLMVLEKKAVSNETALQSVLHNP